MKVIRTMPSDGWVPVANTTAQNHQLSWRARGLLLELLSYPDGYDLTFDRLMTRAKLAGGNCEGRDAMRKAMQELETAGLIKHVRKRIRGDVGDRIAWATVTVVCDTAEGLVRGTAFQEPGDSGGRPSSMSAAQELSNNTDSSKMYDQDVAGQHFSSLDSAREGQQARKQDRHAALERTWSLVDRLSDEHLRNALLDFERKRPAIYRECRQSAISQFERGEVQTLKGEDRGLATDRLSYKYAIMHYQEKLPPWIVKHLRNAA